MLCSRYLSSLLPRFPFFVLGRPLLSQLPAPLLRQVLRGVDLAIADPRLSFAIHYYLHWTRSAWPLFQWNFPTFFLVWPRFTHLFLHLCPCTTPIVWCRLKVEVSVMKFPFLHPVYLRKYPNPSLPLLGIRNSRASSLCI